MTPEEVKSIVGDTPAMTLQQAKRITAFIHEHGVADILELGFFHGVSTTYMAAALEARGAGSIVTIDQEAARALSPAIGDLLRKAGLQSRATYHFEPTSYTWRLMKMLEEGSGPRFDLVYVDGAHTWFVDGFAFFLADRLLRPGGWMIFDDLDWSFATSPALKDSEQTRKMPEDERRVPQVRKIYELLVKPHRSYGEFRTEEGWAYARKLDSAYAMTPAVRTETIVRWRRGPIRSGFSALKKRLGRG